MKPLRISFDFDCTLGETIIQRKASLLIKSTDYSDIFIITARNKGESYNRDLLSVAKRLGIPESNIHYTEGGWKWRKIKELEIDIHFDDDEIELEMIKEHLPNCEPIWIYTPYIYE